MVSTANRVIGPGDAAYVEVRRLEKRIRELREDATHVWADHPWVAKALRLLAKLSRERGRRPIGRVGRRMDGRRET